MVIRVLRTVFVIAAAWVMGHLLSSAGWPWYAWVPAAILAGLFASVLWFSAWFLIRKLTYPMVARTQRNGQGHSPSSQ